MPPSQEDSDESLENIANRGPAEDVAAADPRLRPLQRGMERGYALSPMAELDLLYLKDEEDSLSTFVRVKMMSSKRSLDLYDILDRGISNSDSLPRFAMEKGLSLRVQQTVSEFQRFIEQAAGLIRERKSHFLVDPHGTLVGILRGCNSLEELHLAWYALSKRCELGQDYLRKYQAEYGATNDAELLFSPASTVTSIYDQLVALENPEGKLTYLFDQVPHHHEDLSVSLQGTRSGDFEPPPIDDNLVTKGARRVSIVEPDKPGKGKECAEDDLRSVDAGASASATSYWSAPLQPYSFLASDTNFKSPEDFFIPRSPSRKSKAGAVPGDGLPNPLFGMAAPRSYGLGESASQAKKAGADKRFEDWTSGASATPVRRNYYAAYTPAANESRHEETPQRQGELPPHMQQEDSRTPHGSAAGVTGNSGQRSRSSAPAGSGDPGDGDSDDDPPDRSGYNPRRGDPRRPRRSGNAGNGNPPGGAGATGPAGSPSGPPGPPGGGSDGGGPSNGPVRYPFRAEGAPYGSMVPTIDPKLKVENLPEWDGAHSSAIDYFWDVGQLASLGGWLLEALGYWLLSRLKKGSAVQSWFSTLSSSRQNQMRSHYEVYLQIIKEKFLGRRWQLVMNTEFEQQAFRQEGHDRETPQMFITRRTCHTRMLANADDGGPLEVFLIMRKAPLQWSTILVLQNIASTEDLYNMVNEHWEALGSTLRRLGFSQDSQRIQPRRANLAAAEDEGGLATGVVENTEEMEAEPGQMVRQVYQTFQKRPRPPPPGRYPYAKNDYVTTKMGKAPPSPCKVCGSKNHWDRECPDWSVYLEKQKRSTFAVESDPSSEELAMLAEVGKRGLPAVFIDPVSLEGWEEFRPDLPEENKPDYWKGESKQQAYGSHVPDNREKESKKTALKVHMEEIEDEYWRNDARMPKAVKYTIEKEDYSESESESDWQEPPVWRNPAEKKEEQEAPPK
ncbi:hypothetical protein C8J57DRAFT_1232054 [Mycena rebaudengoi]|nr:hypothetical protein C8J57DRAFT_1232054 [Mycena rebaudengoi]